MRPNKRLSTDRLYQKSGKFTRKGLIPKLAEKG